MEQESNDNIDRLFQIAAEKYPLKTNNLNWDIVAAKMKHQKGGSTQKRYKQLKYAALFLLLLSGGFAFFMYSNKNSEKKQSVVSAYSTNKNESKPLKIGPVRKSISSSEKKNVTQSTQTPALLHASSLVFEKLNHRELMVPNENRAGANQNINNNKIVAPSLAGNQPIILESGSDIILQGSRAKISENVHDDVVKTLVQQKSDQSKDIKAQKKSTTIKLNKPQKAFYGSFFISPDFSTVKFEHLSTPGLKIGVQLGYRINNQFSAEVNLVRYNSRFYSSGKDFSRSNIKIKPTTIIDDVNGKSKFTEVPLDLRYNFSKSNNHFFATAGTSVALVTHTEKYNYDVTKNGTPANISRHFSSQTRTKFFSSINLSTGYESSIFNKLKVKCEPYYQLPIKKFGIGDLPVTHFGVNVGIVKDLR